MAPLIQEDGRLSICVPGDATPRSVVSESLDVQPIDLEQAKKSENIKI